MLHKTAEDNTIPTKTLSKGTPPNLLRVHRFTLLLLTAIFFFNFIARIIPAPLLPAMEKDLGLDHTEAGSLFLFIAMGYFTSLTGAAFISSRWEHRIVIFTSATVLAAALLGTALCENIVSLQIASLVIGLSAGLYLPSGIATLTALIGPAQWGKAIAVHELAPNLAFILAPAVTELFFLFECSWRSVFAFTGAAALCCGAVFFRFSPSGRFTGEKPDLRLLGLLKSEPNFWILIVLFSLAISSTIGVYAMLPLYLVQEHGMDPSRANTLFSLSRVSTLATALMGGWAADRFGSGFTMTAALTLTGITTILLGIVPSKWIIAPVFLQPLLAVSFFPAGFAALSSIGPAESRNIVVSFTVPLAFLIGGGAIPALIGLLGSNGHLGIGFALTGILILIGGPLSCCLKLP